MNEELPSEPLDCEAGDGDQVLDLVQQVGSC